MTPLATDLTVDVKVLATGGRGADPGWREARLLMREVEVGSHLKLVFDDHHRILAQYRRQLPASIYGQYWLEHILTTQKFKQVPTRPLPKSTRILFQERNFSKEDAKYVKAARESDSHLLVTTDPDYEGRVQREIRDAMGIRACGPTTAHGCVCASPLDACVRVLVSPIP